MFNGLDDIDWACLEHAYGSAEEVPGLLRAMRSPDADKREKAFDRYRGAVYHQGSVYESTAASLPFLFEMARDAGTPDRAAVVRLVVGVGNDALIRLDGGYLHLPVLQAAVTHMRRHADALVALTADPDPDVRRAAIPALGLFVDDDGGARAAALLRERMATADGIAERLAVVEATATLALRLPGVAEQARTWLAAVATDTHRDAPTRLEAVTQHARCAPDRIGHDVVRATVALLDDIAESAPSHRAWRHPTRETSATADAPPQLIAAFEDLERHDRVYALTTRTLRTLHEALGEHVAWRTELLTAQLRSPDPGTRLDAVRMSFDLMKTWRGDHAVLVALIADQLDTDDAELAAETVTVLDACRAIAEPAREALAAYVLARRAEHGPNVWAHPDAEVRRAHQAAVCALARHGDLRALPCLLVALRGGIDTWRAFPAAAQLPAASRDLVPLVSRYLREADLTAAPFENTTHALLDALSRLGNPDAVPVIADTLEIAVCEGHWDIAEAALKSLTPFGTAAAAVLPRVRRSTAAPEACVRIAAAEALHALGGAPDEVWAAIVELADAEGTSWMVDLGDLVGRIGPPAPPVLVAQLRNALTQDNTWQRVHAATTLWRLFDEPDAPVVLEALLRACENAPALSNDIVARLDLVGAAARPAVSLIEATLAHPRRNGWWPDIDSDEELQQTARRILARFDPERPA
ncbi:hypothetical protein B4N89_45245 [Embleya scabrispora]|uniref:PBS lyase n=1 Tax=Embleya scabrispora TaxID=159449 RepID=A0A1T3NIM3_9ACTN|nr:hypothetical protein [Embleya scabrispora]OPC76697.1 hypothetical protein B4N89_45245 [Embleya scabrispora]